MLNKTGKYSIALKIMYKRVKIDERFEISHISRATCMHYIDARLKKVHNHTSFLFFIRLFYALCRYKIEESK